MPAPRRAVPIALVGLLVAPAVIMAAAAGPAAGDSFVVIAVVDTGVNPYHMAFRGATFPRNVDQDPANDIDFSAHPSTYLAGFPAAAQAVPLTFGASYPASRAADASTWSSLADRTLYWFPGTKIIGAYDGTGTFSDPVTGPIPDNVHVLDEHGHGTAAASLAVGHASSIVQALCRECLLVVVEGTGGWDWALQQPWIDVVSNSWGSIANVGVPLPLVTRSQIAAERGQMNLFASGNGAEGAFLVPVSTYTSSTTGPSWLVRVQAEIECEAGEWCGPGNGDEEPVLQSGKPADLTGPGLGHIPAAHHEHITAIMPFSGTSAATPVAAGYAGNALLALRRAVGDTGIGQRGASVVARGTPLVGTPFATPAADGVVTRAEWWDIVMNEASPPRNATVSGVLPPDAPANYLWYGYGIANGHAKAQSERVALGLAVPLDKREERRIGLADKIVQETLWGRWDRNGDGVRNAQDSYQTDLLNEIPRILAELP